MWDGLEEVVKVLRSFQVATVWLQVQRYQTLSELLQMHDVLVTDVSETEGELETELSKRLALLLSAGLEDRRELIAGCYITQWAGMLDPTVKTKLLEKH
ncbi:hypothetical protein CF327_g1102 [Tilletia walkeri]|uniref:Uncharacterized protein n=1 Tax=Tilletia walkeri TaxID=117179 RepID=A0A8X7NFR2_9BASI|nr:hypothetical protein CF327_g1102 [Tilletia walkeri]KAE8271704.1 hypothetical protein A4X09_0g616 [Tilletia walkeri]